MFVFSIPMLYSKDDIDDIFNFNQSLEKSKIVSFYDSIPYGTAFSGCKDNSLSFVGLEQTRGINSDIKTDDDFFEFVKYVKDRGFEFVYLLNGTRGINNNPAEAKNILKRLDIIVNRLLDVGCHSFRVGNTATMQYLFERYPNIDIKTSTTLGWDSILQYKNILKSYPKISEFCLHYDINRDFKLLNNLVKSCPDVTKEVMVNELCIKGCPYRVSHYNFISSSLSSFESMIHTKCFKGQCGKIVREDFWRWICFSNFIFPWQIQEYSNIGINNFKIAGRGYSKQHNYKSFYYDYIRAVEDRDFMMNMNFFSLIQNQSYISVNTDKVPFIAVKDIIEFLPDIEHFIKNGYKCKSICEMECNYCVEKANLLKTKFHIG